MIGMATQEAVPVAQCKFAFEGITHLTGGIIHQAEICRLADCGVRKFPWLFLQLFTHPAGHVITKNCPRLQELNHPVTNRDVVRGITDCF